MPKSSPPYPAEYRRKMVELVRAGRTPGELSKQFEASAQTIALTGWGQEEDKRKAKESGFDEHFTKPLNGAVLERLLAKLPADSKPRNHLLPGADAKADAARAAGDEKVSDVHDSRGLA